MQFWRYETKVAHSEIFCFGQGRYWRGRGGWGEGVSQKWGCVSDSLWSDGRAGRSTKGTKGHEGWGTALRRELMGVHSCPDCDLCG